MLVSYDKWPQLCILWRRNLLPIALAQRLHPCAILLICARHFRAIRQTPKRTIFQKAFHYSFVMGINGHIYIGRGGSPGVYIVIAHMR